MHIIWITRYVTIAACRLLSQSIFLIILVQLLEQNDKAKYVNVFMDHLVSWPAATGRIMRAEAFVNLGEPKIPIA